MNSIQLFFTGSGLAEKALVNETEPKANQKNKQSHSGRKIAQNKEPHKQAPGPVRGLQHEAEKTGGAGNPH